MMSLNIGKPCMPGMGSKGQAQLDQQISEHPAEEKERHHQVDNEKYTWASHHVVVKTLSKRGPVGFPPGKKLD